MPSPLVRRKSFLTDTLIKGAEVMRELNWPVPGGLPSTRRQAYGKDWDWFAYRLWMLGNSFHRMSYTLKMGYRVGDADCQWGKKWWQLQDKINGGKRGRAPLGSIIVILDADMGKRFTQGVGQLVMVDRDADRVIDYDNPRGVGLYDVDGGPKDFNSRYHLRLLDGSVISWSNCSYAVLPTIRYFNMLEDIRKDRGY